MPIQGMSAATGPVHVAGVVQGMVIGDHNAVNINVVQREAYTAKEARPLPPHWVERADLASRCADALQPGAVVALVGMGGSGKSALAARVATAVSPRFDAGCFWIDLAAADVDDALLRIALAFGHDLSPLNTRDARAGAVRSLLAGHAVLLVLDDAWSSDVLAAFLPPPAGCAAILTTRNDAVAAGAAGAVVEVRELAGDAAVALLAALCGASADDPALAVLSGALGGLPLALELAGKLARQQARRPGFALERFAADYADAARRLSLGLAGSTVRAAFEESWTKALRPDVQRAFALLGCFEPGPIATAEAAAAWGVADAPALALVNELIDLSFARPLDAVTLELHPLLHDYAREKLQALEVAERNAAHCRVADYLFGIAARPPRTLPEMRVVLRSHRHAAAAGDRERASRVFPWFGEPGASVAVPGFLIDHGQHLTHLAHERLQHALGDGDAAWARAWSCYRLGDALAGAGETMEARQRLEEAVSLIEGPDVDDDGRVIGLSKFLMRLGQVQVQLGDMRAAESALRRAVEIDRESAQSGHVVGAFAGALIGMLQLADLHAQDGAAEAMQSAERICRDVAADASAAGDAHVAVMALARLARYYQDGKPEKAAACVRHARELGEADAGAFEGRQGARYARLLADTAANLAYQGAAMLDDALSLYHVAVHAAGAAGAAQELGQALYQLGNLFEHYALLGLEPPLAAAWACYSLADQYTRDAEGGPPLNAIHRIEQRIAPRVEESQRREIAATVRTEPWRLIEEALQAPRSPGTGT